MFANIDWFDFVVGGIIIGFLVNVASNFAQPKIENWWGKYNISRRNKNEALRRAFDEKVEYLANNKHEELIARLEVNRLAAIASVMMLLGITAMVMVVMLQMPKDIITIFIGILPAVVGFGRAIYALEKRNKLAEILNAVDKKLGRRLR
jgi:hypothetical protein